MLRRQDRAWPRLVVAEIVLNPPRLPDESARPMTAGLPKSPIWLMLIGLLGQLLASQPAEAKPESADRARPAPTEAANFSLRDHEGKARELYAQTEARAVVLIFTITGCPIVQKSSPRIKELRDEFGPKGIVFWLVNSNAADDPASIREEAGDFKIDLPILLDHSQSVARQLGAKRTAEAVCIQGSSWTVAYRGAIDDQFGYGTEKKRASQEYLRNALKNLLAGKKIKPARTDFKGCLIQFEPSSTSGTK